jgi:hypothetical protein
LDRIARGAALAVLLAACSGTNASPSPSASSQPSQATPSATGSATALDGAYATTFTREELAASPLADPDEINDENWGELTLTFADGRVTYTQKNSVGNTSTSGVFTVDGDAVTMAFKTGVNAGETFGFRWSTSGATLTFTRDDSVGIGPTPFLVKSWTLAS